MSFQPLFLGIVLCILFLAPAFFTNFGNLNSSFAIAYCLVSLSVFFIGCSRQLDLEKALTFSIYVHLICFFVQVAYFGLFFETLDMLKPITGEVSRQMGDKGINLLSGMRVPRFSGLFNEPGTYGCYFGTLLAFYSMAHKGWSKIEVLGIFSLVLSMSLFAFVVAIFILVSKFFKDFEKRFIDLLFVLLGSILVGIISVALIYRADNDLMEFGFRLYMINDYLTGGVMDLLFGKNIELASGLTGAVNDAGLWFTIIYDNGLITLILVCCLIGYSMYKWSFNASPLLLILLLKVKLSYPMFWLFFLFFLFKKTTKSS